ncbi:MAG: glycosyltransferase, partial [Planctomycetota bacterium]|nr:glycosyltransferase [Planctomycetota bacterium]
MSAIQKTNVSVVVPTIGQVERLRVSLPPILRAVEARGWEPDEVLVVDDSVDERAAAAVPEVLGAVDATRTCSLQVVATGGVGFARAVAAGAERAGGSLLLVCQDDVALEEGALDALAVAMGEDEVFAAGPVLRQSIEAPAATAGSRVVPHVRLVDDRVEVVDACVDGPAPAVERATFLPSRCVMVRRADFLALGGFDDVFAPFGWEDVDLGIAARRRGMRVVRVGDAGAVHHGDLPSLWDGVDEEVAAAAFERNRLLLRWKHLATRGEAAEHLVSLWRQVLEAGLAGDRRTLEQICLAFDRLPEVTGSRAKLSGATL